MTTKELEPILCEHCGLPLNPGDSYTLRDDGSFSSCQHWHLNELPPASEQETATRE